MKLSHSVPGVSVQDHQIVRDKVVILFNHGLFLQVFKMIFIEISRFIFETLEGQCGNLSLVAAVLLLRVKEGA